MGLVSHRNDGRIDTRHFKVYKKPLGSLWGLIEQNLNENIQIAVSKVCGGTMEKRPYVPSRNITMQDTPLIEPLMRYNPKNPKNELVSNTTGKNSTRVVNVM